MEKCLFKLSRPRSATTKLLKFLYTKIKYTCYFLVILLLLPALVNGEPNLVTNGGFESVSRAENLWDGVDGQGRLKVFKWSYPNAVDMDGDGLVDIICGDEQGWTWYYKNSGTKKEPKFTNGELIPGYFGLNVKPHVVDWNGDGKPDLVIGHLGGKINYVQNVGSAGSPRFVSQPGMARIEPVKEGNAPLDIGSFASPFVTDWDGDGKKDLLLGEGTYSANSVYLYLNTGSDSLPLFKEGSRRYLAYGDGREHLIPFAIDWNKDGTKDLIVGDKEGHINIYLSPKTEKKVKTFRDVDVTTLEYKGRLKAGGSESFDGYCTPYMTDWDNDGDMDIIFGMESGFIKLCVNNGTKEKEEFSAPVYITGTDTMKDFEIPAGWNQYMLHHWKPDGGRHYEGSFLVSADKDSHNGQYGLKVTNLFRYPGKIIIETGISNALKIGKRYNLTFWTKGDQMRLTWELYHYERGTAEGKPAVSYRGVNGIAQVSSQWNSQMVIVDVPGENKGQDANCALRFTLEGKGYISIDEVSLTPQ
ncbi:MAG: VCBS repeat-containing protein [Candidatus Omnitrophica bacterium]|nr:VCBS repeat-containing protein [Candidatus Omnitrophota bacterium]